MKKSELKQLIREVLGEVNSASIEQQIKDIQNKIRNLPSEKKSPGGGIPSSKSEEGRYNEKLRKKENSLRDKLETLYRKQDKQSLKENINSLSFNSFEEANNHFLKEMRSSLDGLKHLMKQKGYEI